MSFDELMSELADRVAEEADAARRGFKLEITIDPDCDTVEFHATALDRSVTGRWAAPTFYRAAASLHAVRNVVGPVWPMVQLGLRQIFLAATQSEIPVDRRAR